MISMMYAGLCTLLVIVLALRVVKLRREHGVGLGHGGNMQLLQATRAHANATENMPLALILLSSLELTGYPPAVIHAFGGVFLFSEAFPSIEAATEATPMGQLTLADLLGVSYGTLTVAVVIMAVAGFAGATWVERRLARH